MPDVRGVRLGTALPGKNGVLTLIKLPRALAGVLLGFAPDCGAIHGEQVMCKTGVHQRATAKAAVGG